MREKGPAILLAMAVVASAHNFGAVSLAVYPDARTTGLGNTGVALADGAGNAYYNPAVLCFAPHVGVSLTHADWLAGTYPGMSYNCLQASYQPGRKLSLGAALTYLDAGIIEITGPNGEPLGESRVFDIAPAVSAGYRLLDKLSVGTTAKFVGTHLMPNWVLGDISCAFEMGGIGFAGALDAGLLYRPWTPLNLGLSFSNLGLEDQVPALAGQRTTRYVEECPSHVCTVGCLLVAQDSGFCPVHATRRYLSESDCSCRLSGFLLLHEPVLERPRTGTEVCASGRYQGRLLRRHCRGARGRSGR